MKRLILVIIAVGVPVGFSAYIKWHQNAPASPESVAQAPAAPATEEPLAADPITPTPPPPQPPSTLESSQHGEPATPLVSASRQTSLAPNSALNATLLSRTVDRLVSPQATYPQKRDAWKQLREAGQLDQVI